MKQSFLLFLVCLLGITCSDPVADKNRPAGSPEPLDQSGSLRESEHALAGFDFSRFEIGRGRVGNIFVGQSLSQAEYELKGLEREEIESYGVGFDGGGEVYLYSYNNEPLLALVPSHEADSLIAIVAIHKELKTKEGLHPKMTVKDLIVKYPAMLFYQDLLNGGEISEDSENGWNFVFDTKEENEIGVYPEFEVGSKAYNLGPKMAWITVK